MKIDWDKITKQVHWAGDKSFGERNTLNVMIEKVVIEGLRALAEQLPQDHPLEVLPELNFDNTINRTDAYSKDQGWVTTTVIPPKKVNLTGRPEKVKNASD